MSVRDQEAQESHKHQKNEVQEGWNNLPESFSYQYLNPEVTSTEQFLAWLDDYAITHNAVNHYLLHNFYQGTYGKNHARIILRFLKAYRLFNNKFVFYVKRYGNLIGESECDHKTPYNELFDRVVSSLELHFLSEDRIAYQKESDILMQDKDFLQNIAEPLLVLTKVFNNNFDRDENKKSIQRISAIYWGSEHIGTKLYAMIYQALQQHTNLSSHDLVFFPLRIHWAEKNSIAMRTMLLKLASTSRNRKLMAKFAYKCLNRRIDFYEKIQLSFSQNIFFEPVRNKEEEEENETSKHCVDKRLLNGA